MEQLIPGLPDDVARECLARVSYTGFPSARTACKQWREEFESSAYHELRRRDGLSRTVVALAQSAPSARAGPLHKHNSPSIAGPYWPVLFDAGSDDWSKLPYADLLFPNGLPLFCQLAGVGRSLVVVGGWDPTSWAASSDIFVYSFLTGAWRRGRPMPGPCRSFFACASDGRRYVYVAGGHDDEKNALKSAVAYDVEEDEWVDLPDMARERDECKGIFRKGAFVVVGGYSTEMQGQFGKSSEAFDVDSKRWCPVEEEESESMGEGICPRTCVAGEEGIYRCNGSQVEVRRGMAPWEKVAELPEEVRVAPAAAALPGGRLMVVGSACHGGTHSCYVLEQHRWRKAAPPEEYSGHVQASCSLQI